MSSFLVLFPAAANAEVLSSRSFLAATEKLSTTSVAAAAVARHGAELLQNYDDLKFSVLRINTVGSSFDWLQPAPPSRLAQEQVSIGSGFVIALEPEPLIVTNAHVIADAQTVDLQLLVLNSDKWSARVVSVCHHFDLALLKFADGGKKILQALEKNGMALRKLDLVEKNPDMGTPVISMGFPLGQELLKLSAGEVAGNQDVYGRQIIMLFFRHSVEEVQ